MSPLFRLYRYLATSRDRNNEENPYNKALRSLESTIDLLQELDTWGERVKERGGFEWEDALTIVGRITEGCKTALCVHHGDADKAILDFAETHLPYADYDQLIHELRKQQDKKELQYEEEA